MRHTGKRKNESERKKERKLKVEGTFKEKTFKYTLLQQTIEQLRFALGLFSSVVGLFYWRFGTVVVMVVRSLTWCLFLLPQTEPSEWGASTTERKKTHTQINGIENEWKKKWRTP